MQPGVTRSMGLCQTLDEVAHEFSKAPGIAFNLSLDGCLAHGFPKLPHLAGYCEIVTAVVVIIRIIIVHAQSFCKKSCLLLDDRKARAFGALDTGRP